MVTTDTVRRLLESTTVPDELAYEWLSEASAVWLMGQPAELVAGDLVLCHPPLAPEEVRAVARPTSDAYAWRMTIAAHDRPGLLADLAAVLADQRLSITDATATTLPASGIALQ